MAPKVKLAQKEKAIPVPRTKPKPKKAPISKKNTTVKNEVIEAPAELSSSSQTRSEESHGTDARWRQVAPLPLDQQVKIKEAAKTNGCKFLRGMRRLLNDHNFTFPGNAEVETWLKVINELLDEKEGAERLVGFLGATGAGKTTFINAVLGFAGLLPTSSEKSSTATVTKIASLRNANPGIQFSARIDLIQLAEFKADLDRFYKEVAVDNANKMEPIDDNSDSEDEDKLESDECGARIGYWLKKLKAVYPHMTDDEIIGSSSEEMIADTAVQQVLTGGPVIFEDFNLETFARNLKPYVDGSQKRSPGSRNLCHWPLVRVVNLFVKSPVLDHNLVLVDLPGSDNDSNEARAAIAENFKEQLLITCIVAPAKRAISDKGANMHCSKHEELRLMMDGSYQSSRLCFVMSQIDDMPIEEFKNDHSDMSEEMKNEEDEEAKFEAQILAYKANDASKKRQHDDDTDNAAIAEDSLPDQKRVRRDIKGSAFSSNPIPAQSGSNSSIPKIDMEAQIALLEKKIARSQSVRKRLCILRRNQGSKLAIENTFIQQCQKLRSKTKKKYDITNENLKVFCVSASKYHELEKVSDEELPYKGFLRGETGIEEFRAWCIQSTLPARDEKLTNFLIKLDFLRGKLSLFSSSEVLAKKLPREKRDQVEKIAVKQFGILRKVLRSLEERVLIAIEEAINKELGDAITKAVLRAKKASSNVVRRWEKRKVPDREPENVRCNTYRAIAARDGVYQSYVSKIEYNWIDTLADSMIDILKEDWTDIFDHRLIALRERLLEETKEAFQDFTKQFSHSILAVCRGLQGPLQRLEPNWDRLLASLLSNVKGLLQSIRAKANTAWRKVKPVIPKYILSDLKECGAQRGRESFVRCKAIMLASIRKHRHDMYGEAGKIIRDDLSKAVRDTVTQFKGATEQVVVDFSSFFNTMLEQSSSSQSRGRMRKVVASSIPPGTVQLQQMIKQQVSALDELWCSTMEVTKEEEEDIDDNHPDSSQYDDREVSDSDFEITPDSDPDDEEFEVVED